MWRPLDLEGLRRLEWFQPSSVGGFPFPDRWPGWVALLIFIVLLAATVTLPLHWAGGVRIGLCLAYVALSYLTLGRD